MTHSAFIPAIPKGRKNEQARIDLIVALDEEYNILMKMEILPVALLRDLLGRADAAGLITLAGKIRKEIGDGLPDSLSPT